MLTLLPQPPIAWLNLLLVLGLIILALISRQLLLLDQRQQLAEIRYQSLLNTVVKEGVWIVDAQGRTTDVNQRLAEMLGYTVEEMLTRSPFELIDEADRSNFQQHFKHCQSAVTEQSEYQFHRKDNSVLSCLTSTQPLLTQHGAFVGMVVRLTEVTQSKPSQEELQHLQDQLKQQVQTMDTILSASLDHYYMFDREGRFIYASRAGLQVLGLQQADIIGKTERELGFPPDVIEPHIQRRETVFATGEILRGETSVPTVDGVRYHEYILIPILDESGSVQVVVVTSTDVTERKQVEEELRQYRDRLEELVAARTTELAQTIKQLNQEIVERKKAEEALQRQIQYQQLLAEITLRIRESLQIEVILQTTVTELQQVLQADRVLFYRLLPHRSGQVVAEAVVPGIAATLGQKLLDRCFEEEYLNQYQQEIHAWSDVEQADFQPCHLEMLRQFQIRANLVVPILLKDERWGLLFIQQCSAPREWNSLEIALLQQLANQLSIALAQAELLEQETCHSQELARSNAELEQFAYVASHDLQEPLRTLASYAKLLSRRYSGQLDAKADRFMQYIMEEALRMQALINDLLKYSRVGRQAQNFAPCDCAVVFEIVVKHLAEAIRDSGATVTCRNLPSVMASEMQLVQLFQNLISNAIKYRSSQPPVIEVAAEPQEDQWLFWVRDNGIGIDQKYAERIFAIFQRLHTHEEYSGTGIGLAIAAKIVERHGGRIWVESELGQGSTFYFTLQEFSLSRVSHRTF